MPQHIDCCEGVPAPTSPISHAVVVGNSCWISGQHALDDEGQYHAGTADEEASRCFELLVRIAAGAGFAADDIVFVEIAFADLQDLAAVNSVFERYFSPGKRPARTIHQASRLAFGARLKVSAVAARSP